MHQLFFKILKRNILKYKKPSFRIVAITVTAVAAAAVFLLANPAARLSGTEYKTGYSAAVGGGTDYDGVNLTMRALKLDAIPTILTVTWHNGSDSDITFGDYYWIYKYENGKWVSCTPENDIGFNDIAYPLASGDTRIKNYFNYGFDLSRTGSYRLKSYFFFDKDVPITEDEHYNVWLDFEITDEAPVSAALETGVYAVDDILYTSVNPAGEAIRMYAARVYSVENGGFRIADAQSLEERAGFSGLVWQADEVNPEEWYGMFPAGMADVDIGGYASRLEYDTGGVYRLYLMDGEVWLAELNGDVFQSLLKLQRTDISTSGIVSRKEPDIPENETLRSDSPDGTYRAEAYGTNKSITAAGLYPYEGLRVIRNSDETAVWKGDGYYKAEFLWSGDSRYVAVYGEARIYGECFVVDADTGKVIELPDIDTVSAHLGSSAQPAANRPDPFFKAVEWMDGTMIRINYRWTAQEGGKEVSGTYDFNIISGDILANTFQISDPPG